MTDPYAQINALAQDVHGGRPLIVSTFSGYGGLDMGVARATGGRVVAHVEWEAAPSRILAHHWPDVPNLGDVSTVDWSRMPHGNRVIITTGFPCQDVSLAGLRRGLKSGTRSGLWSEVALAIDEIRPGLVVIENVRGLLSAEATSPVEQDAWSLGDRHHGPTLRALGAVLGDLADLGYDARWCGLRAADAGAPHGRFRVFVIAYPAGQPWRPTPRDTDGVGAAGYPRGSEPGPLGVARDAGADVADADGRGFGVVGRLTAVGGDADRRGRADADGDAAEPEARLLPTPLTSNRKGAGVHGDGSPNLQTVAGGLLPTPMTSDSANPSPADGRRNSPQMRAVESLLPTPMTADGDRTSESYSRGNPTLAGALLPTPTVGNVTGGNATRSGDRSDELLLPGVARAMTEGALLPTPTVVDMGRGKTLDEWDKWTGDMQERHGNGNGHGASLEIEAQRAEGAAWGPFAAAVDQWEHVSGRAAPAPTNPDGKHGAHRLAPEFSEWMMGLPAGHVTDPDIWTGMKRSTARGHQLKAIGNGVVPQHAELAVRSLVAAEWAEVGT